MNLETVKRVVVVKGAGGDVGDHIGYEEWIEGRELIDPTSRKVCNL